MTNKELDDLLKSSSQPTDPTVLANIVGGDGTAATPVRPLPPAWIIDARLWQRFAESWPWRERAFWDLKESGGSAWSGSH